MDQGALAFAAHQENRLEDALQHYVLHLREQPESGLGWVAFGILLHTSLHDLPGALLCYQKAVELLPEGSLADLHLGMLQCEIDRQDTAIRYLRRHIDSDPGAGRMAYADLACAHMRLGQPAAAAAAAADYRAALPDDHFAPFLAAWIAAAEGRLEEALALVTDCAALDPMFPLPLGLRGLLLSQLGRDAEAVRVLQEMVTLHVGQVIQGVPPAQLQAANRLWRDLRGDAKRHLGLRAGEAMHCIVLSGGLGDQFGVASLLGHFKAANPRFPLVVFSSPAVNWQALFPGAADLFVKITPEQIGQLYLCNRFFPDHPYTNFFPWLGPLVSLYSVQEITRFDLGLPQSVRGRPPTIPRAARRTSIDLFHALGGKPGRGVLISPVSNSNPNAGMIWWQGLVEALDSAGFTVFQNMTNVPGRTPQPVVSPAVPVELPVEQVIPFCEAAGHFVGIRSGLCDLLGFATARMKAIHVRQRYARNDHYPLSVWLDSASGFAIKRTYQSQYWQDYDIERDAIFDPAVIADWLAMD